MKLGKAMRFAMKHPKITKAAVKFAMKHPQVAKAGIKLAMNHAGNGSNGSPLKGLSQYFNRDTFG